MEICMDLVKKNEKNMFLTTQRGNDALFLEYVNRCTEDQCPFFERCGFLKDGLCGFEASFFVRIVKFLLRLEHEGRITETAFTHCAIAILPLYRQLLQLYKVECSLDGEMFMIENGRQTTKIHPVYKEIREVLSKIADMWRFADVDKELLMRRAGPSMDFAAKENVYQFVEK